MKTIVFVCTGNTCRSPMAEGICRKLLRDRSVADVEVTSCGVSALTGMPPTDHAVAAAAAYGADISAHRSRPLSQYLVDTGDLFVCMTQSHAAVLSAFVPAEKIRILSGGVPDPFGGSAEDYRTCAAAIRAGLDKLIEEDITPCK